MQLPAPTPDALDFSAALVRRIAAEIVAADGWIGFDHFMELALYAPGQGYYSGGAHKFGAAGDFVTAPELGPAFAQALATQVAQLLALSAPAIIEVGAGSGQLASDLLRELERRDALPASYAILELSGELQARQRQTLAADVPHLLPRVDWLERLPERFDGLVLANEVLDAMPVKLVRWDATGVAERGVAVASGQFTWVDRPASGRLRECAQALAGECALPAGYLSEVSLAARAWVAEWAAIVGRGALLLIDYGFPRREYYHWQRDAGTLMCHYRHHAHAEPFYLPGLQDITAHVDFTAIVESGCEAGFELLGYCTQSSFLFNCGLTEILARTPANDPRRYLPLAGAVNKLVSPAEMGELFKVMALGKGVSAPLLGFASGDRSATL
ncbi:MAG: SAM-dependent methyltransferase [Rhodobacteraceae bacterium]|uniref:class I SAM-dependent methyltransferase n=1 Tax=Accumulibacter sp. TaxID=2053492 RepID=UPI0019FC95AC|nr:SAM-dependent methyltransferase [Accumulibacter sp.]MBE2260248.1 SAM-dependent methyltransferase [Paracoccaceae bacterium]